MRHLILVDILTPRHRLRNGDHELLRIFEKGREPLQEAVLILTHEEWARGVVFLLPKRAHVVIQCASGNSNFEISERCEICRRHIGGPTLAERLLQSFSFVSFSSFDSSSFGIVNFNLLHGGTIQRQYPEQEVSHKIEQLGCIVLLLVDCPARSRVSTWYSWRCAPHPRRRRISGRVYSPPMHWADSSPVTDPCT